ncbi:hypothetical protein BU25DRAFT_349981 [Macroventuria anomochaeta]|uniref:Uncharacterized protein n=1 Tax=Macroventuria anomochaeta TaxID=301207 RepID=A0ACB6RNR8_9PLEO|nr:uncharacterized protein BU25DRAFT_349981 [Macroventuria anomochaeta]KAF2623531.1 hypothetical protein BU25DRAFT_349981 [Macroventuria anomochaeta]
MLQDVNRWTRGTGKTQVALQFAYMVKESWPDFSIFWLPVLSMESFEQACAEVARQLGIDRTSDGEDDAKEQFQRYLSTTRAGKWLLVVDNADDADILFGSKEAKGIVDYLPQSKEGVIMFTTRTLEVADSLIRSHDLLRSSAGIDTLLDKLTCLPLAIAQAAAYLNKTRSTIDRYLQLLDSTEQNLIDLMSKKFRDDTRYDDSANAVATTWVVSFDHIRKRDKAATDLLMFISCIEWKAIPRSILPSAHSEVRMDDAIGTLCGYSFVVRRGNEELYDVHQLVHLATRVWVRQYDDARGVTEKSISNVAGVFPSDDYANPAVWRAYLPHALRLLEDDQGCKVEKRSKLCLLVGQCLLEDGRTREAGRWLKESCEQRQSLDKSNSDRLISQHNLAKAYQANGQIKEAVKLLEGVVAIEAEVLTEDHPDRLASQHNLAGAYQANGQTKKAVKLLEAVVAIKAEVLAEDHPDRLASQHELARAYRANGQTKEAVSLLKYVVKLKKRV